MWRCHSRVSYNCVGSTGGDSSNMCACCTRYIIGSEQINSSCLVATPPTSASRALVDSTVATLTWLGVCAVPTVETVDAAPSLTLTVCETPAEVGTVALEINAAV